MGYICKRDQMPPCQYHFPRHCLVSSHIINHVNLHVIIVIHVITISTATSYSMSSMCDMAIESVTKIILFMTLIFVIENGLGLGFRGPGDIPWRFQNVMDRAIYDENLRNVTRCDLWRSIHDAIWDRHRYCFMTVFQWSVTKSKRHGSTDFL